MHQKGDETTLRRCLFDIQTKERSGPCGNLDVPVRPPIPDGTPRTGSLGNFLEVGEEVLNAAGTRPQPDHATDQVLHVPPRREGLEEHLLPRDFLDPNASIAEPSPDRLVMDDLTEMSLEGNQSYSESFYEHCRHGVKGGELIMNPCQRVFGCVICMCSDNVEGLLLEVDFREYFGVQKIRSADCLPWVPTPATPLGSWGIEGLLRKAQPTPCTTADMEVLHSKHTAPSTMATKEARDTARMRTQP
ncbi:hypothetical protein M758_UG336700 [Ceratodon purpureus]|nr:hypothetical protein M758_UG336700 [Ceratodon purpureus]